MSRKLYILGIFLILGFSLAFFPQPTYAQRIPTVQERAVLIDQINFLLEQISLLQQVVILMQEQAVEEEKVEVKVLKVENDDEFEIIETKYFGYDFEAIYEVTGRLNLIRRDVDSGTRLSDLRLWDLFVDTIGRSETSHYIDELRIFDKSTSNIGAFVELHRNSSKPDYWILGINEDDFDSRDSASRRQYSILFIHEYAHLLIEDEEDILNEFKDEFWSTKDLKHAQGNDGLSGQALEDSLEEYYEDNEDDFVSDYATYNPDEDFAETFVYFIINDKPNRSVDEWEEKVLFMYEYDRLRDVRDEIRENMDL